MRDEYFPDGQDDDLQGSHLIDECRDAFDNGTLASLTFSEEEFEYLLEYFAEEAEDEIVVVLAESAYEKYPYSTEIIIRYSDVLIAGNSPVKAMEILSARLALDPGNYDILFLLGRGEIKLGNYQQAGEYINRALTLGRESVPDMLITAGQDYIEQNEFERALEYFDTALNYDKEELSVYEDIAFCLEKLEKPEESLKYYLRYLDKDPFSDYVWFNVGTLYARSKNYDKALEAFEYAIALNPENSSAIYNKAIVYIDTFRYETGIRTFKELLKHEPGNIYAMITIADASLKIDDPESARLYYKMALETDPQDIDANTGIANLYMKQGDYYNALFHLRSIADSPDVEYSVLEDQLLVAYRKTGNKEFMLYYLLSQYYLKKFANFNLYTEMLTEDDKLWIKRLYTLLPDLKNEPALTKKILKGKTR
ncbi:MAG: tetratricopeptide repeat protein [Bacteroidales bacterium]|nr:tetratricopeptide repeat protein [Bacteroidales bacterium]MDD2426011.1 tetratricopeptide repeat protein [Bacteroidales bacterium]MDD3990186.1 tetratricopeptide repeat protein [Bacteroidales bacterium]MDD4639106.1 tetratricopeptide repeat protein [Bacteroidales bacterium]